jgi:CHASE2 domain-containing sensor protein
LLSLTSPVRTLEQSLSDSWFQARGQRRTQAQIVLVGLDDTALERMAKPAAFLSPDLAEVVTYLKRQGAAAIGLDLIVPESLEHGRDAERLAAEKLGQAVAETGNVVLAKRLLADGRWQLPLTQWQFKALSDPGPNDLGFVNLTEDADQTIRRQQLLDPDGSRHFALALFAAAHDLKVEWKEGFWVGGQRVVLDEEQRLRINFTGPPGSFPLVPFDDVLTASRNEWPLRVGVRDAVVIVGGTTQGQLDAYATPFASRDGAMSGPELHGHIIATLTDRAYLRRLPGGALFLILLGVGVSLGIVLARSGLWKGGAVALLVVAAWAAASLGAFSYANWRIDVVPVGLLGLLVYGASFTFYRHPPRGRLSAARRPGQPDPVHEAGVAPQAKGIPGPFEQEAFSSQWVVLHYPVPVALAFRRFLQQPEPRSRLDMLFAALEATLRYLVALGVSDLFQCLARKKGDDGALPAHGAFDFLRKPKATQLGMWCEALRETARALAGERGRVIDELPAVCRPGGRLDTDLLARLVAFRNQCAHPGGGIACTPEECRDLLREARPTLEAALQEIRFVCRYPLGFVRPGIGSPSREGERRILLHSCMGSRVRDTAEAYAVETTLALAEDLPFVVTGDGSKLLSLWPLLLQRVSPLTGRHTLYLFEGIPSPNRPYLTEVRAAAVDVRETWSQRLREQPATNHTWLLERLRDLPSVLDLPPELRLAEQLSPARGGKLLGRALGAYRLRSVLGGGGFGVIYAALNAAGELVAVKVIESPLTQGRGERFLREFDKLKQVGPHPGILRCYESGVSVVEGREYPWYAMEFALGGDLSQRLAERRAAAGGALPWEEPALRDQVIADFTAIVAAVAHLHRLGIVHRDLKPANILILADGTLRLADFGLVKTLEPSEDSLAQGPLTSTGAVLGTHGYMAPEQEKGQAVGKPADVYALGMLLAEMALGERVEPKSFPDEGSPLGHVPLLGKLPRELRKLLLVCTDVDPARRPADAAELEQAFVRCLTSLGRARDHEGPRDDTGEGQAGTRPD